MDSHGNPDIYHILMRELTHRIEINSLNSITIKIFPLSSSSFEFSKQLIIKKHEQTNKFEGFIGIMGPRDKLCLTYLIINDIISIIDPPIDQKNDSIIESTYYFELTNSTILEIL